MQREPEEGTYMRARFRPPDPARLEKHIRLYGTDGVLETLEDWAGRWVPPLSVWAALAKGGSKRRGLSELELRSMQAYLADGMSAEAVARAFNITERRVTEEVNTWQR